MADFGDDVFFATIPELNARLKAQRLFGGRAGARLRARLQQLGPRYNALALPLPLEALRKAREVDKDLKRERFRGPLQGIPYGVKDLLSYAGQPTTWGAKPYAGQVFDYNATVIDKLDGVGAVITGKLVDGRAGGRRRIPLRFRIAHRSRPESVGPHALVGRIVQRTRCGGSCRPRPVRDRVGDLGVDRHARVVLRRHGAASDVRSRQPPWRDGAFLDIG